MKRAILVSYFCFLATVCFAQERYSSSEWKFTFTVPEGWEVITDEMALRYYAEEVELRFENEKIDFYKKVRHGYHAIADNNPDRVMSIDATRTIKGVQAAIQVKLDELLNE